jgi:hypothetical protein
MSPTDDQTLISQLSVAVGHHAIAHSAALVLLHSETNIGVGSATCVDIAGCFFLATAGHNLDGIRDPRQIRIVPPRRGLGDWLPIESFNSSSHRGSSAIDVAWIRLSPEVAAEHGLSALPLSALRPGDSGMPGALYLAHGIRLMSRAVLTPVSAALPGNPAIDLPLDFGKMATVSTTRSDAEPDPHPAGMSGGGVWAVADPAHDRLWDPSRCHLVGVIRATKSPPSTSWRSRSSIGCG